MTRALADHKRIVLKIGSALLVQEGRLRRSWLESLIEDLVALKSSGARVMIVSSGAIALGRGVLKPAKRSLKLEESQAAAAVGQILLGQAYSETLGKHRLTAGQILLTLSDTEERRKYLNARATIETLFKLGAVPIVNENDTVATSEIRYGDNDRLAARVATMASADLLILLSDVDGLYTAPPADCENAEFIAEVPVISEEIEAMAGNAGSELSRGGMKTKIDAAKIATGAGTSMIIASGREDHPLKRIDATGRATWFPAPSSPGTARKAWIGGHLETKGALTIDAGAINALQSGKSLLPAGVTRVSGSFSRGDAVRILAPEGRELGRGLVAYDRVDAQLLIGRNSREIEALLGYAGRAEMIHRDNLVLDGQ